jgi:hypothetical protein
MPGRCAETRKARPDAIPARRTARPATRHDVGKSHNKGTPGVSHKKETG